MIRAKWFRKNNESESVAAPAAHARAHAHGGDGAGGAGIDRGFADKGVAAKSEVDLVGVESESERESRPAVVVPQPAEAGARADPVSGDRDPFSGGYRETISGGRESLPGGNEGLSGSGRLSGSRRNPYRTDQNISAWLTAYLD